MSESSKSNLYFASDFHLGVDLELTSKERENRVVQWLEQICSDAKCLVLLGDVFDYWFEYKYVVPKHHLRLFGALAKLIDSNTEVHFIKGNHDMWIFDYFQNELGILVHDDDLLIQSHGKRFYFTHGDGLDQDDYSYRLIKSILRNPICQKIFSWFHPSIGIPLMKKMSHFSRGHSDESIKRGHALIQAKAQELGDTNAADYFICGHIHDPLVLDMNNITYVNTGDWMTHFTYGFWDGTQCQIIKFDSETIQS